MKATICDECHDILFEEGYSSREDMVRVHELVIYGKDEASVTIANADFCNVTCFNKRIRAAKKELNS